MLRVARGEGWLTRNIHIFGVISEKYVSERHLNLVEVILSADEGGSELDDWVPPVISPAVPAKLDLIKEQMICT